MPLIGLVLVSFLSGSLQCNCKTIPANETSHGANEFVLIADIKVNRIAGKVLLPNEEPVNEAIVEVFNYSSSSTDYKDVDSALNSEKRAACMTGKTGAFCFDKLPPGRYLLRAGTRKSAGINQIHAIITVLPKNQKAPTGELELRLTLGT
jgi:protocatechuate 3,4-dioxygenase beta subunit